MNQYNRRIILKSSYTDITVRSFQNVLKKITWQFKYIYTFIPEKYNSIKQIFMCTKILIWVYNMRSLQGSQCIYICKICMLAKNTHVFVTMNLFYACMLYTIYIRTYMHTYICQWPTCMVLATDTTWLALVIAKRHAQFRYFACLLTYYKNIHKYLCTYCWTNICHAMYTHD